MGLQAGTKLGSYEIGAPLSATGTGELYRAKDLSLQREVAIKILTASFGRDTDRPRRFTKEAQATAALNHPNIVSVYQIGQGKRRAVHCVGAAGRAEPAGCAAQRGGAGAQGAGVRSASRARAGGLGGTGGISNEPRQTAGDTGTSAKEPVAGCGRDGKSVLVLANLEVPAKVCRVDIGTGKRQFGRQFDPRRLREFP
jgi:hypothetical protein